MRLKGWAANSPIHDDLRPVSARRHLRARLAWMDTHLLDDIGVSGRDQAWIAASKTNVPRNWLDAPIVLPGRRRV